MNYQTVKNKLSADCENCFGLCCVALPYAKSADFAFDKDGGIPCENLQSDYRCGIHNKLRNEGFKGCTVYECFGAGQKVSQVTYKGRDWRNNPETAKEMFDVFPIMQQLHEMLYYLEESMSLEDTKPIYKKLGEVYERTEELTNLDADEILSLDIPAHRAKINELLLQTSGLIRSTINSTRKPKGKNLLGAKLRGADLKGADL